MRTPQEPVGSGFGAASTTNDVVQGIDLSGKTAIVTGGYAGLGLETTRTFASAGARVVVCRPATWIKLGMHWLESGRSRSKEWI